jgi:hypothetical protein
MPYRQVLGTISLPAESRQILEERYLRLLETSFRRCRRIALVYNMNRLCITIGSIIVPALLSIQRTDTVLSASIAIFWTTWIISLMVTISNGLMTMFKFDRKYYLYHASFEQLKTEGWQYFSLTGNYRDPKAHTHEQQFGVFAQTIERIRMRQTEEEYVKLQDVAGIGHAARPPLPPGAIPTVFDYGKTPLKGDPLQQILAYIHGLNPEKPENSVVETGDELGTATRGPRTTEITVS